MQQAEDFLQESRVLSAIVEPLSEAELHHETLFKGWTIDDVIGHLHMFNHAADLTAESGDAFMTFFAPVAKDLGEGKTLLGAQRNWLDGLSGTALRDIWREGFERAGARFRQVDPRARLRWVGPDMSARSCITARQMETWAHGQEVFDRLNRTRAETDRIKNIAHLGVATYGWVFANRGMKVPEPAPYVRLSAPSGAVWEWNELQDDNSVAGSAVDFCRTVTQVRNVADTNLETIGAAAENWMEMAQCFAGQPNDPPAPGSRHKHD